MEMEKKERGFIRFPWEFRSHIDMKNGESCTTEAAQISCPGWKLHQHTIFRDTYEGKHFYYLEEKEKHFSNIGDLIRHYGKSGTQDAETEKERRALDMEAIIAARELLLDMLEGNVLQGTDKEYYTKRANSVIRLLVSRSCERKEK